MGLSNTMRDAIAHKTFVEFGSERLDALCHAAVAEGDRGTLQAVFRALLRTWGDQRIGVRPRYASNVADDEAPFEFSVALSDGAPELQVYVEAQGEPPGLLSNMHMGRALLESVAREFDAPLDRVRCIEDLFFPDRPGPPFSIWIGASWRAGRGIALKVYLNPQVRGPALADQLVTQAMTRLGLDRPWSRAHALLSSQGQSYETAILSLDLLRGSSARVKVYLRHRETTVGQVEAITCLAQDYHPGDVAKFYRALMLKEGPFLGRPAITELAFVDSDADRPASSTVEFPIGSYVANDQVAAERVENCMAAFGIPCDAYRRAISAFATRPLAERGGIHAHVTLRRVGTRPRMAVYLASEAYVSRRVEESTWKSATNAMRG